MKSARGFTLVELLIVITIIAVLSVIGITVFSGIQKNARDSKRRADIDAISKAFEVKYNNNGTGLYGDLTPANNNNLFASGSFPKDPQGQDYTIILNGSSTNAQGFRICAALQDNSACAIPSKTCFCQVSSQGPPPDTTTPTINAENKNNPNGNFDSISCTSFAGWACDNDLSGATIQVNFYDGPTQNIPLGSSTASNYRGDLVSANVCGGTGNHGFTFNLSKLSSGTHNIYVYANNIDSNGITISTFPLSSSPKTISCP